MPTRLQATTAAPIIRMVSLSVTTAATIAETVRLAATATSSLRTGLYTFPPAMKLGTEVGAVPVVMLWSAGRVLRPGRLTVLTSNRQASLRRVASRIGSVDRFKLSFQIRDLALQTRSDQTPGRLVSRVEPGQFLLCLRDQPAQLVGGESLGSGRLFAHCN